ncbi:B12-binding domain-containing radical SAM protein [Ferrimonas balearica]|uniref:B12-binding domain-containing radical SAM protein n=1 Tax=Ferrimonas balearica TaxID=44012 RepID=UPI001C990FF8|nr:radical SAM protein [Ferrimonas balearica]MBY5992642.1 radical SAM protein [Ferrimonas balearica]
MHIALVKVCQPSPFKQYKAYMSSPPQSLFALAAATPEGHNITLVDETLGESLDDRGYDLIALVSSTPDVQRAYRLADTLRARGRAVVLCGLHVTALPEEAASHADAVLLGEAEISWPQLLADHQQGALKPLYNSPAKPDLAALNPWPSDPALQKKYGEWGVTVGRGCRHNCSYCTVRPFFKREAFRPVAQVVAEIRASGARDLELHCDNLCADREYAMALFSALAPLDIRWSGEATLDFAEDEELVAAAVRSGLWYLVVGLETACPAALKGAGKGFIDPSRAGALIERLHRYNVLVDSCLLLGFDQHDSGIFERTLAFVDAIDLDVPHPNIVTPFPGTRLYQQLAREERLLTRDWQRYDCAQAVFQPAQMSVETLEQGVAWLHQELWSIRRSLRRARRISRMQGPAIAAAICLP